MYLLNLQPNWEYAGLATYVLAATDRRIDLADFQRFTMANEHGMLHAYPHDEDKLEEYLSQRGALLLTDEYAPTDILLAQIQH